MSELIISHVNLIKKRASVNSLNSNEIRNSEHFYGL